MKLFCFPYAGGASNAFLPWKPLLAPELELDLLELAGRGRRLSDSLYETLDQAVDDLYPTIIQAAGESPFILFGHSMGALIAYELAVKLKTAGHKGPDHIFFSGLRAPHLHWEEKSIYHLNDAEFTKEILELGGTATDIFQYPQLAKIYMPILRADFKITNTYSYIEHEPLDCDFTVIYGDQEFAPPTDIEAWRTYTTGKCRIIPFPGGHFFINEHREQIITLLNKMA